MTTKPVHRYSVITDIDYSALEFNPDAPEPLPDGMFQFPIIAEIYPVLDTYLDTLGDLQTTFRSSNTFICYDPDNLNVQVRPDFYVAFNVGGTGDKETAAVPAVGGWEAAGLCSGSGVGKHRGTGHGNQEGDLRPNRCTGVLAVRQHGRGDIR